MEEWITQNCGPDQFGEQDENGVDLSLILANLRLTPEQRLREGDQKTRTMISVRIYQQKVRRKFKAAAPHLLPLLDALDLRSSLELGAAMSKHRHRSSDEHR